MPPAADQSDELRFERKDGLERGDDVIGVVVRVNRVQVGPEQRRELAERCDRPWPHLALEPLRSSLHQDGAEAQLGSPRHDRARDRRGPEDDQGRHRCMRLQIRIDGAEIVVIRPQLRRARIGAASNVSSGW